MRTVLLDTGCIVALLDRSDRAHERVRAAMYEIESPLVTCEAVIAESCYLMRNLRGASDAILANVDNGSFLVSFDIGASVKSLRAVMKKYRQADFADACLICMAEAYGTGNILTLDSDFLVYRWGKNRVFNSLV